jgi:hypothetical protein
MLPERFTSKFTVSESGCWEWTAFRNESGYGQYVVEKSKPGIAPAKLGYAHRYAYEQLVGPIPEGLHLDHLCRNPPCCNPDHLEPVTPRENVVRGISPWGVNARKTHCIHGHEFNEQTYIAKNGARKCRPCQLARVKARKRRLREQRQAEAA